MTTKLEQAARQIIDAWNHGSPFEKYLVALDEALSEPQITTPDVCGEVCARAKLCYGCGKALDEANAKYAEQAEQEPVAITMLSNRLQYVEFLKQVPLGTKLYAAPVRTKDLTPHDITALIREGAADGGWQGFAQRVIAADRALNNPSSDLL